MKEAPLKSMLSLVIAIVVLVLIASIGYRYTTPPQKTLPATESGGTSTVTALFICADQKSIAATFYPDNDTHVDLSLSDGRMLSVPHAISASGARYATEDESFVFWNKGNTAFITENGTTTYAGCVIPHE